MKKILSILFVLTAIISYSQDSSYEPVTHIFSTMNELRSRAGVVNTTVSVSGYYTPFDGGGGTFRYVTLLSLSDTVPGILMRAGTTGMVGAQRLIYGSDFNYQWFGGINDGVTYNQNMQAAIDYIHNFYYGGTLNMAGGRYMDTTHALLKSGVNIKGGSKNYAYIINDIPRGVGGKLDYQSPLRLGNYGAPDFDTVNTNWYAFDSVTNFGDKIVMHNLPAQYVVGKIMMIHGGTYWQSNKGVHKYHYTRTRLIASRLNDTITFDIPLDSVLTVGKIYVDGDFKTVPLGTDPWGQAKQFVVGNTIENVGFISDYGQPALCLTTYKFTFNNIYSYGWEGLFGNGIPFATYNNYTLDFAKQLAEFSVGAENVVVNGLTGNFVDITVNRVGQPAIKFGENCFNIVINNLIGNFGEFGGKPIYFNSAFKCGVNGFTISNNNSYFAAINFSTQEIDSSYNDSSYDIGGKINDCFVRNGTFYSDYNNSMKFWAYYYTNPIAGTQMKNDVVDNVTFYGSVQQKSLRLDGQNPSILNCYFSGIKTPILGDNLKGGRISGGYIYDLGGAETIEDSILIVNNVRTRYRTTSSTLINSGYYLSPSGGYTAPIGGLYINSNVHPNRPALQLTDNNATTPAHVNLMIRDQNGDLPDSQNIFFPYLKTIRTHQGARSAIYPVMGMISDTTIYYPDTAGLINAKEVFGAAPSNVYFSFKNTSISPGTTDYFTTGEQDGSTTLNDKVFTSAYDGTVKNLLVSTSTSQPGGGTLVVTLLINGSTALQVTIPAGSAAGVFTDDVSTMSFSRGAKLTLRVVNNDGGSGSANLLSASCIMTLTPL